MIHHSAALATALCAFVVVTSACARQIEPPVGATKELTAAPVPPPAPTPAPPPALSISPEVQSQCSIHEVESTAEAPKFAFDSSLIGTQEMGTLQQLATCFLSGPLKGRSLKLVGRADPRGTQKYNQTLGEKRASAVQGVLVNLGLSLSNVTTTSRGEKGATGTDEEGWQLDRRVDVDVSR